jgi:hypothetical protein
MENKEIPIFTSRVEEVEWKLENEYDDVENYVNILYSSIYYFEPITFNKYREKGIERYAGRYCIEEVKYIIRHHVTFMGC